MFAGLVPNLRQHQQWLIVSCRPKDQPFYQLALALVHFFYPDPLTRSELELLNHLRIPPPADLTPFKPSGASGILSQEKM